MIEGLFEEVLHEYLQGHLSMAEANARLKAMPLSGEQAGMWARLKSLDESLAGRAEREGGLPWLKLQVAQRIDAREQARRWLKGQRGTMLAWFNSPLAQLISPRAWMIIGAVMTGGAAGYVLGGLVSLSGAGLDLGGITITTLAFPGAMILAALAAFFAQWPQVREFYT